MSKVTKEVSNWESIQANYSIEFVETAIHAYEHSKEYHKERNARIAKVVAEAKANGTY